MTILIIKTQRSSTEMFARQPGTGPTNTLARARQTRTRSLRRPLTTTVAWLRAAQQTKAPRHGGVYYAKASTTTCHCTTTRTARGTKVFDLSSCVDYGFYCTISLYMASATFQTNLV
jgi:hypothetical protein